MQRGGNPETENHLSVHGFDTTSLLRCICHRLNLEGWRMTLCHSLLSHWTTLQHMRSHPIHPQYQPAAVHFLIMVKTVIMERFLPTHDHHEETGKVFSTLCPIFSAIVTPFTLYSSSLSGVRTPSSLNLSLVSAPKVLF